MGRLSLAAAIAVLGALVFTAGAQACSCAPMAPADAMRQADAAIVGRLVEVVPRSRARADYRYRVRRVYRGAAAIERGDVISVRSARSTAACGLPRRQNSPVGLFLLLDGRRWTAGACSMIAPHQLRMATRVAGESEIPPAGHSCAS